jgi:hypothetical protein
MAERKQQVDTSMNLTLEKRIKISIQSIAWEILFENSTGKGHVTFPLKTRALAWRFTCVEIGPTGNGPRHREEQVITVLKDTQAGMAGLRALSQARQLRCHLL